MFDGETKRLLDQRAEPTVERERPLSEVRGITWKAFLGCWMAYIAAALLFFGGSTPGLFMVSVVAGVALAFFGIPWALLKIARKMKPMLSKDVIEVASGRISQTEALMQIVLAPAALAAAMAFLGYIAAHQERADVWTVPASSAKQQSTAIPSLPMVAQPSEHRQHLYTDPRTHV